MNKRIVAAKLLRMAKVLLAEEDLGLEGEEDQNLSKKIKDLRSLLPSLRSKGNKTIRQMGIEEPIKPNAKIEELIDAILMVSGGKEVVASGLDLFDVLDNTGTVVDSDIEDVYKWLVDGMIIVSDMSSGEWTIDGVLVDEDELIELIRPIGEDELELKMSEKLRELRSVLPGLRSKGNKTLKQMGIDRPIMPNAKVEGIIDALLLVSGGKDKKAGIPVGRTFWEKCSD